MPRPRIFHQGADDFRVTGPGGQPLDYERVANRADLNNAPNVGEGSPVLPANLVDNPTLAPTRKPQAYDVGAVPVDRAPAVEQARRENPRITTPSVPSTQVLPQNLQPRPASAPTRNNDLGGAVPATAASIGGAAATAALVAKMSAIPALAPLLSNPVTAAAAIVIGGVLVASPWIYNKLKQKSTNNKIDWHERQIKKILDSGDINNPAVRDNLIQKINQHEQRLAQLTGRPQGQRPPPGQPWQQNAQSGPTAELPGQNGQAAPENDFWHGRKAFNEQVPLFTPKQQLYQESILDTLKNNPVSFDNIRNEELRRFHEETAPQIAEQYFGKNPQSFGGAYPEALGRGGASLGSRLAAMQAEFENSREERNQRVALQPSFTTVQHPREPGAKETALKGLIEHGVPAAIKGISSVASNYFGTPDVAAAPATSTAQKTNQPTQVTGAPLNSGVYNAPMDTRQAPSQLSNVSMKGPYAPGYAGEQALQQLAMQQADQKNYRLGGR